MRRIDIEDVFRRYGTDKLGHGYAMVYQHVPVSIRSVFEIGVASGASLRSWRDLFPLATVYGIDVGQCDVLGDRILTIRQDIKNFNPSEQKHDLVVDDGSHSAEDIIEGWKIMQPRCSGMYVVEDVQANIVGPVFDALHANSRLVSVIPTGMGGDDLCIVAHFERVISW